VNSSADDAEESILVSLHRIMSGLSVWIRSSTERTFPRRLLTLILITLSLLGNDELDGTVLHGVLVTCLSTKVVLSSTECSTSKELSECNNDESKKDEVYEGRLQDKQIHTVSELECFIAL